MKIAILYICTGKYDIFWKEFYNSCEKYFFTTECKDYYVYTDSDNIYNQKSSNVHKIYQKTLGWPGNTLYRYHLFAANAKELEIYDYIFFFNANVEFKQNIGEEILPKTDELIVVQHPGFYNKTNNKFTYERNCKSTAYIPHGKGKVYVCGGVNGGTAEVFLKLIDTLKYNIDQDDENKFIALWHDESHINKYILNNKYKLLSPAYAYPEGWKLPFECKILIRDKEKYGGHNFLRDKKESCYDKIICKLKKYIKCVWERLC